MADALVSGASVRKDVEVQLLSAAPTLSLAVDYSNPAEMRDAYLPVDEDS